MSSNSFAIAKSAAAKLKMKMLPAGFVALCSTAMQSCDRHKNRSFLLLRIADFVVDAVDVVDVSVSEFILFPPGEHLAFFRHCFNAGLWSPSAFKRRIQCLAFCIEKHDVFLANIVLCQRISVSFLCIPPRENRWMAAVFWLSCFLKHLLRLEEHDLSFRLAVLWSSSRILLNDKARDRNMVVICLLVFSGTSLVRPVT